MMLEMENHRISYTSSLTHPSSRLHRSGCEPSDAETDQESPWHPELFISKKSKTPGLVRSFNPISMRSKTLDPARTIDPISNRSTTPDPSITLNQISSRSKMTDPDSTTSPLYSNGRCNLRENYNRSANTASRTNPVNRRHNKSPYSAKENGNGGVTSIEHTGLGRNTSPLKVSEHRSEHVSPYRTRLDGAYYENNKIDGSTRRPNQRRPSVHQGQEDMGAHLESLGVSRISERSQGETQPVSQVSEMSNFNQCRSLPAQNLRATDQEQHANSGDASFTADQMPLRLAKTLIHKGSYDSYAKNCTPCEPNERIVNLKLSKSTSANALMQTMESISIDDIFISRKVPAIRNGDNDKKVTQKFKIFPENNMVIRRLNRLTGSFNQSRPVSTMLSQTNTSSSTFSGRASNGSYSSKFRDSSGKISLTGSFKKFTVFRQKIQTDTWLSCARGGTCTNSKSPDSRAIDETLFIERAFVVEELRPFWADKHRPHSLCQFICQKQQAQHFKKLITDDNCSHILLKGPSGSGKKSLSMALLYELFGDSLKISHDLRQFYIQETSPVQIVIPLTSSAHHMELNLRSESKNARHALMDLVKEIIDEDALAPKISDVSFKADYKVIILYDVDKVNDSIQHLIRWIMDRYADTCRMILCCEDDAYIIDSVKTRCKLITLDAPATHEIMEVLIQISKKEKFELSMSFASIIATKSKQNLRKAIMALEACKVYNYPFVDEQPIPLDWEEVLVGVASEILTEPSAERIFFLRGKIQKLLEEFVHPRLILQKLVEQFLKGVKAGLKRELYYWHAYYDKRLPAGESALLKLEEFLAKFMSIYRKSNAIDVQVAKSQSSNSITW